MYWWAYPSRVAFFLLIPIYLGCGMIDEADFALYKSPVKYLAGGPFVLGLIGLIAFGLASYFAEPRTRKTLPYPKIPTATVNGILTLMLGVTLAAYLIFLFPIVTNPGLILDHLHGSQFSANEMRLMLNRIPGITTFMTMQSMCIVMYMCYSRLTKQRVPKVFTYLIVTLAILCVLRAWLWSERIAILELILPTVIIRLADTGDKKKAWLALAPLLGIIALFGLFALGEYFRSWQVYQGKYNGSFIGFALVRFAGYYATALNNGAGFFQIHDVFYYPHMTAEWLFRLPLWSLLGLADPNDLSPDETFLFLYANPEFNNMSAIFMPFVDYGLIIGLACWVILGFISGSLCRAFASRQLNGVILYPIWYAGVTELLRYFYWGSSRFFLVLVSSLLLGSYLNRLSKRQSQPSPRNIPPGFPK